MNKKLKYYPNIILYYPQFFFILACCYVVAMVLYDNCYMPLVGGCYVLGSCILVASE